MPLIYYQCFFEQRNSIGTIIFSSIQRYYSKNATFLQPKLLFFVYPVSYYQIFKIKRDDKNSLKCQVLPGFPGFTGFSRYCKVNLHNKMQRKLQRSTYIRPHVPTETCQSFSRKLLISNNIKIPVKTSKSVKLMMFEYRALQGSAHFILQN